MHHKLRELVAPVISTMQVRGSSPTEVVFFAVTKIHPKWYQRSKLQSKQLFGPVRQIVC